VQNIPAPSLATLLVSVQFVSVGVELQQYIPPPKFASLLENAQPVRVGKELRALNIPPPKYPLARLPENLQFVSVGEALE
jgi:hypothetical protein